MAAEDTSVDCLLYPLFASQTPNYVQNERSRFNGSAWHRLWQPVVQSRAQLSLPAVPGQCPGQPPAQLLGPQLSTMDRNPFGAAEGGACLCILVHTTKVCWHSSTGFQTHHFCLASFPALSGVDQLWKAWGHSVLQLSTALGHCLGAAEEKAGLQSSSCLLWGINWKIRNGQQLQTAAAVQNLWQLLLQESVFSSVCIISNRNMFSGLA